MMEFLSPDFLFRNAILGGWVVCTLCAVLGVYVVLRRMVLLGVALPQSGAAGIAAVFYLTGHVHGAEGGGHWLALAGSLGATFASLALLVVGRRSSQSPIEWRIGAALSVASAATLLFVAIDPTGDLEMTSLLRGELLSISNRDLELLCAVAAVVSVLFALFRREILLVSFDPEFARTVDRVPARWDALLYLLLGVAISVGVMTAGPMVVFAFLVLPALTALRMTSHLLATFAVAAAVATLCAFGGFAVAYRADLPAGPVYVMLAALCWLVASGWGRLRRLRSAATAALLLAACALVLPGCSSFGGASDAPEPTLDRGSLPDLADAGPIAVLRFRNDTGQPLRMPGANPLGEARRAVGMDDAPPDTVPDELQRFAAYELARRGYQVTPIENVRAAIPTAPSDPDAALELARAGGITGPLMLGRLTRFTRSGDELVLIRLDLELVDPKSGAVAWRGSARRPVPIKSALTAQEVLRDAAPRIFAEAFAAP